MFRARGWSVCGDGEKADLDAPSLVGYQVGLMTNAQLVELGRLSIPSGRVLLLDPLSLPVWRRTATPSARARVDLEITGPGGATIEKVYMEQSHPRFLFDRPADLADAAVATARCMARGAGIEASARVLPEQVPHRARVELALELGGGAGEIEARGWHGGVFVCAPTAELRVLAEPMPWGRSGWGLRRLTMQVQHDVGVARSESFARITVAPRSCLMVGDLDAIERSPELGASVGVFPTTWGGEPNAGPYEVVGDLAEDGSLVGVRIELETAFRRARAGCLQG